MPRCGLANVYAKKHKASKTLNAYLKVSGYLQNLSKRELVKIARHYGISHASRDKFCLISKFTQLGMKRHENPGTSLFKLSSKATLLNKTAVLELLPQCLIRKRLEP